MYCKECGANIPEQRICPECGCLSGYRGTLPQPAIQKKTANSQIFVTILCALGILLSVISFINVLGRATDMFGTVSRHPNVASSFEGMMNCIVLPISGLLLYPVCIAGFLGIMVKKLRKLSVIFPVLLTLISIIYLIGGRSKLIALGNTVSHRSRETPKIVVILLIATAVYLLFLLLKRPSIKLHFIAIPLSTVTAVSFVLTKGIGINDRFIEERGLYRFSASSLFYEYTNQGPTHSPIAVFTSAVIITVFFTAALTFRAKEEKRSS